MVKCKNCREQGCNSETGKAPWYCELCFWMKRMDKKMVIHIVSEMNLEKIKTSFTSNKSTAQQDIKKLKTEINT